MPNPGRFNPAGEDWITRKFTDLERALTQLRAANPFAPMGIIPRKGGIDVQGFVNSLREDGTVGVSMDDDGVFVVYDAAGTTPVARFGPLDNSAPGQYGVEVLVGGTWVQIGAQTTTWATVSGKPAWAADSASIDGSNITGSVPHALDSDRTDQADGVTPEAFARDVGGITGARLAMWMHEDGSIGYNTSSIRFKRNVRDFTITPEQIMQLRAVKYDRKAEGADDPTPPVSVDELGLIAEEVAAVLPELAIELDGQIASVRYELLAVALLPMIQQQQRDIEELKQTIKRMTTRV